MSLEGDGFTEEAATSAGAAWQCWNGTMWMDTHQLVKGFTAGVEQTIEVVPGVDTSIPAIGLPVPSAYPIVIPDVAPGTYRIVDEVVESGEHMTGTVLVTVVASDE